MLNASPVAVGVGKADLYVWRDERKSKGKKPRERYKMRKTDKKERHK
jgi:hypothetical protein